GGPKDDGRPSYQVAIATCPSCERTHHGEVEVDPVTAELAACDAQTIDTTHVGTPARATQTIPPAIRRLVKRRSGGRCGRSISMASHLARPALTAALHRMRTSRPSRNS